MASTSCRVVAATLPLLSFAPQVRAGFGADLNFYDATGIFPPDSGMTEQDAWQDVDAAGIPPLWEELPPQRPALCPRPDPAPLAPARARLRLWLSTFARTNWRNHSVRIVAT
jgi:hypothetical protein